MRFMGDSLRERLQGERMEARWRDLAPHALRDAVFIIAPNLDLLDVGTAMARNDTKQVERWLAGGVLRRPDADELRRWKGEPGKMFGALIVDPFVIIQESQLPASAEDEAAGEVSMEELARFLARRGPPSGGENS
jgi:hypothetical protein